MKNILLVSAIGLLLFACNKNKTSKTESTPSISIDSSSSGTSQSSTSDNMTSQRDSVAIDNASKSGAASITPKKDSTRRY